MRHFFGFSTLLLLALSSGLHAQKPLQQKTKINVQVRAVDLDENPLANLTPGQYARLRVRADLGKLPSSAAVAVGARATFNTTILGRPVSYTVSLPAGGTASSLLNPAIGVPGSGQPLGKDLPSGIYEETFDFQVPPETPPGIVTITVRLSGTSLAPYQKSLRLQVVRR
jgi:hypothetical protein